MPSYASRARTLVELAPSGPINLAANTNTAVSTLPILMYPDTLLRTVAKPVATVDGRIDALVGNMLETMYEAPGIGLAATQINVHERVVVIDVSEESDSPLVLINPTLQEHHGEAETQEGCLSIPGIYETIKRPAEVQISAIGRDGEPFELSADGLLATCIQHEIDHLNGKLFVDYLSVLKRNRIRKKMLKQAREQDD